MDYELKSSIWSKFMENNHFYLELVSEEIRSFIYVLLHHWLEVLFSISSKLECPLSKSLRIKHSREFGYPSDQSVLFDLIDLIQAHLFRSAWIGDYLLVLLGLWFVLVLGNDFGYWLPLGGARNRLLLLFRGSLVLTVCPSVCLLTL